CLVPGERSEVVVAGEGRGGGADQPRPAHARRDRPHLLRRRRALAHEGSGVGRRRLPQGAGAGFEASRRRAGAAADRAAPRQATEEPRRALRSAVREAEELMGKETLLVADPDPRSLRILELALRRAGFEVQPAVDGREALEKLLGAGIQGAVCDAALPAPPDAIALCRAARAEQRLATVPFVLVGEDRTPAARAKALEAGADDYLAKPVLLKELIQRVQHLLDRRRLSDPPATPVTMTGSVRDLGLVDVLQSLETWKKSALVRCENAGQLARIWVCDGEV